VPIRKVAVGFMQVDVTDEQLAVVVLDLLRAYPGGLSDAILLTEVTKAFSSKKVVLLSCSCCCI
jgi:hypothetical protein